MKIVIGAVVIVICLLIEANTQQLIKAEGYELVAEKKSCNGGYTPVKYLYSISDCAALCNGNSSMFLYARADSDRCTKKGGCKCYCMKDAANGRCTQGQQREPYYNLYRYTQDAPTYNLTAIMKMAKRLKDMEVNMENLQREMKTIVKQNYVMNATIFQIKNALSKKIVVDTYVGDCVDKNGKNPSGESHLFGGVSKEKCLAYCKVQPNSRGCVWKITKHCWVYTGGFDGGDGDSRYTCWKFITAPL